MDKFKQKIQARMVWISAVMIISAVVYFILPLYKDMLPVIPDFIRGFHAGAFAGIEIIMVFFLVRYAISLRSEKELKKLYIEENDERTLMIMQKSGAAGMTLCIIGFAIATIAAGFFDKTVFFVLLGATLFTAMIKGFIKIYYHRKL